MKGFRTTDHLSHTMSMDKGKDVKDTKMLKGEASKDSLIGGPNRTVQHSTSNGKGSGPYGGMAKRG